MVLTGQVSLKKGSFKKRSNGMREIKMKGSEKGKAIGTWVGKMYPQEDLDDTKVHVMALTGHNNNKTE